MPTQKAAVPPSVVSTHTTINDCKLVIHVLPHNRYHLCLSYSCKRYCYTSCYNGYVTRYYHHYMHNVRVAVHHENVMRCAWIMYALTRYSTHVDANDEMYSAHQRPVRRRTVDYATHNFVLDPRWFGKKIAWHVAYSQYYLSFIMQ